MDDDDLFSLLPVSATVDDCGCVRIAGHCLGDLARQYGTPLYVYDGATVRKQIGLLKQAFSKNYKGPFDITYAAKAYFSLEFAKKLLPLEIGLDVVSLAEMVIARKAGFSPEQIHLHGNNKSVAELEYALDWGIYKIVVDSLDELDLLESLAAKAGKPARIWLRITPGIEVDTHPYWMTGHIASKFGIPMEDGQAVKAIRKAQGSKWLNLTGLHTHVGSQLFDPIPFQKAMSMLFDLAVECNFDPQEMSPGGGWGISYVKGEETKNVDDWIRYMAETVEEESRKYKTELPKLLIEPGRWIVGRAGVAIYEVGMTKFASDGAYIVAVDGGMADNPRVALYEAKYTACLVERPFAEPKYRSALVGKYCESGDQLIPEIALPEVKRGELIAMPSAGAYQLSMASNYNLAPRPAVLWLDEGKVEVLQKREIVEEKGWWLGE